GRLFDLRRARSRGRPAHAAASRGTGSLMNRRTLRLALALAVAVAAASTACRSGAEDDPILRLSAIESLAEGRKLLDAAKYRQARPYLQHAFEVEPNSATGREALLL